MKLYCQTCGKTTEHRKVKTDTLNSLGKVVTQYLCKEHNNTGAEFQGRV